MQKGAMKVKISDMRSSVAILPYILGIALAGYTYIFYLVLPHWSFPEANGNVMMMGFVLFVLVAAYFFKGDLNAYIKEERSVLFILLLWFVITFVGYRINGLFLNNPNYYAVVSRNFYYLTLVLIFVSLVDRKVVNKILIGMIGIYFLYGFYLMVKSLIGYSIMMNENVVAFFLLPFLSYMLFYLRINQTYSIVWYVFGSVLLFLSGGETSFLSFFLLPFFYLGLKFFKNRLRLFYLTYILTALSLVLFMSFVVYAKYESINLLFSQRLLLWKKYVLYVFGEKAEIFGTGNVIMPWIEIYGFAPTIHAHNQFITMFAFNGFVGLILYLAFLLYSVPRQVNQLLPIDAVLFSLITVQFAEAIIPFFDFSFLSLTLIITLFITRSLHKESNHPS